MYAADYLITSLIDHAIKKIIDIAIYEHYQQLIQY